MSPFDCNTQLMLCILHYQITAKYLEERESKVDHRNAVTETRRAENLKKEEERWDAIEKREQGEIDRQRRLQEDP